MKKNSRKDTYKPMVYLFVYLCATICRLLVFWQGFLRGKPKKYRIGIIAFEEKQDTSEERIAVLKRVIKEHDKDWKLVQIGLPEENRISVMFQQKRDVVEKE